MFKSFAIYELVNFYLRSCFRFFNEVLSNNIMQLLQNLKYSEFPCYIKEDLLPVWKWKSEKELIELLNDTEISFQSGRLLFALHRFKQQWRYSGYYKTKLCWVRWMILSVRTLFILLYKIICSLPLPSLEFFISHHLVQEFQNTVVSL